MIRYFRILIPLLLIPLGGYCQNCYDSTDTKTAIKLIYGYQKCRDVLSLTEQEKEAWRAKFEAQKVYSDSCDAIRNEAIHLANVKDSQLQECKRANNSLKQGNKTLKYLLIGSGGLNLLLLIIAL